MKRVGSATVESSVLFLVASFVSLEVTGTYVTLPVSGDYYLNEEKDEKNGGN